MPKFEIRYQVQGETKFLTVHHSQESMSLDLALIHVLKEEDREPLSVDRDWSSTSIENRLIRTQELGISSVVSRRVD